jgi:hypothetical protein
MEVDVPKVDRERSILLCTQIRARAKRCFGNALKAVRSVPELHDAWYVEGVAIGSFAPMPFAHAWVELPDGTLLDPTAAIPFPEALGATGDRDGLRRWLVVYIAGNRFTAREAEAHWYAGGLPANGGETEGMRGAWEAAWTLLAHFRARDDD